jgi:hypothetical protein
LVITIFVGIGVGLGVMTGFGEFTYDGLSFKSSLLYFLTSKQVVYSLIIPAGVAYNPSNLVSLNPYFVTGFANAESSFIVSIRTNNKLKTG